MNELGWVFAMLPIRATIKEIVTFYSREANSSSSSSRTRAVEAEAGLKIEPIWNDKKISYISNSMRFFRCLLCFAGLGMIYGARWMAAYFCLCSRKIFSRLMHLWEHCAAQGNMWNVVSLIMVELQC